MTPPITARFSANVSLPGLDSKDLPVHDLKLHALMIG